MQTVRKWSVSDSVYQWKVPSVNFQCSAHTGFYVFHQQYDRNKYLCKFRLALKTYREVSIFGYEATKKKFAKGTVTLNTHDTSAKTMAAFTLLRRRKVLPNFHTCSIQLLWYPGILSFWGKLLKIFLILSIEHYYLILSLPLPNLLWSHLDLSWVFI